MMLDDHVGLVVAAGTLAFTCGSYKVEQWTMPDRLR